MSRTQSGSEATTSGHSEMESDLETSSSLGKYQVKEEVFSEGDSDVALIVQPLRARRPGKEPMVEGGADEDSDDEDEESDEESDAEDEGGEQGDTESEEGEGAGAPEAGHGEDLPPLPPLSTPSPERKPRPRRKKIVLTMPQSPSSSDEDAPRTGLDVPPVTFRNPVSIRMYPDDVKDIQPIPPVPGENTRTKIRADSTPSVLRPEYLNIIRAAYYIPREYELLLPSPGIRPTTVLAPGYCLFPEQAFISGLRFPLHPFVKTVLNWAELSPMQYGPNSWKHLICFILKCQEKGVRPKLSYFRAIFSIGSLGDIEGVFFFTPRPNKKVVHGHPDSIKNWRDKYFVVKTEGEWDIPTQWNFVKPKHKPPKRNELTAQEWGRVAHLLRGDSIAWRRVTEVHLARAGLSPADPRMTTQQAHAKQILLAAAEKARQEKKKKEEQERLAAEKRKTPGHPSQAGGPSTVPPPVPEEQPSSKKQKKHHHPSRSARDPAGGSGKTVEAPAQQLPPVRPSAAELVGRMATMPFAPDWSIVKGDSILDGPVSMEFVSKAITDRDGMALAAQTADQAYMRWAQANLSSMLHGQHFHKCLEKEITYERKQKEKFLRELTKAKEDFKEARDMVVVHEAQIESLDKIHKQDREDLLKKIAAETAEKEKAKKALADLEAALGDTLMTAQDEAYEQAKSHFKYIYPECNVDHLGFGWKPDLPPTPGGDGDDGGHHEEEVHLDPQD